MTEKKPPNSSDDQGKPKDPTSSFIAKIDNVEKDTNDSTTADKTGYEIHKEWPNVIVNMQKDVPPKNITGNVISLLYTLLTAGLLIATYNILSATKDSVRVAQDALVEVRRKDSIDKISDSISAIKQDSIFHARFKLDSTNTAQQIQTMKSSLVASKNEFKSLNAPYLEITNPVIEFSDNPLEIKISYFLENLKPFPAQIITKSQSLILHPSSRLNADSIFKKIPISADIYSNGKNAYMIKETPFPFHGGFTEKMGLTKDWYEAAKNNQVWLYIANIIKYRDLISGDEKEYRSLIAIQNITDQTGHFYAEYKYNQNIDLDKRQK